MRKYRIWLGVLACICLAAYLSLPMHAAAESQAIETSSNGGQTPASVAPASAAAAKLERVVSSAKSATARPGGSGLANSGDAPRSVDVAPRPVAQIVVHADIELPVAPQMTNEGKLREVKFSGHILSELEDFAGETVLYAPANPDNATFRGDLATALSGVVDYYDPRVATPTLAELTPYDVVLTWVNFAYADAVAMGNVLADYVDAGGRVILGQWCVNTGQLNDLEGAIMGPGYVPITGLARTSGDYAGDGVECVHDGVVAYGSSYFDECGLIAGNNSDGTFTPSGTLATAWRPDSLVWYSPGNTGTDFGTGDWVQLTANMIVCGGGGGGPMVLYAPSNPDNATFRSDVGSILGGMVDYYDASAATPTLAELMAYDAVVTWVNFAYADNVAMGNVLADYVDAGGRVILGQWCYPSDQGNFLDGRIITDAGYCPVTTTTSYGSGAYAGDGTECVHTSVSAYDTSYLDEASLVGGTFSDGTFTPSGTLAAAWRADAGVWYSPGNTGSDFGTGDWAQLTANMITCAGGGGPGGPGTLYFSEDNNGNGLYTLDTMTGAATNVGISGVTSNTVGLAPSSAPALLYGSKWSTLLHINSDGSGATDVGGVGTEGLAYDQVTGTLYGAINTTFFTVDPATGTQLLTLAAPAGDVEGIAFGNGGVYGIVGLGGADTNLYWYDPGTDVWNVVGDTGIDWNLCGLAYDPGANVLYAKNGSGDTLLYKIDAVSAATTVVGDTGIGAGGGLAFVGEGAPPDPCPADVNDDGVVDVLDLLAVIAAWGNPGGPADVNGDGIVDVLDLLAVISAWGPCPGGATLETLSVWDGTSQVCSFGETNTATYGQTFVAPADSTLVDFTMFINDGVNPDFVDFQAAVGAWDSVNNHLAGPALWIGSPTSTTNNGGLDGMEQFTFATGGVALTPGQTYVIFWTACDLFDGENGTGCMGYMSSDEYPDGQFVFINNGNDCSQLTSVGWSTGFAGDLAFEINFAP